MCEKCRGDISECSIASDLVEFAVDLSSVSLSSQRLFLKSFGSEDAFEAFEATTQTLTRFMKWEPAPSLEAFAPIWQSWIPIMCAGTDVHFVVRVNLLWSSWGWRDCTTQMLPSPKREFGSGSPSTDTVMGGIFRGRLCEHARCHAGSRGLPAIARANRSTRLRIA